MARTKKGTFWEDYHNPCFFSQLFQTLDVRCVTLKGPLEDTVKAETGSALPDSYNVEIT